MKPPQCPNISWWICSFVNCFHPSGSVSQAPSQRACLQLRTSSWDSEIQLRFAVSLCRHTDKRLLCSFASFVRVYVRLSSVKTKGPWCLTSRHTLYSSFDVRETASAPYEWEALFSVSIYSSIYHTAFMIWEMALENMQNKTRPCISSTLFTTNMMCAKLQVWKILQN